MKNKHSSSKQKYTDNYLSACSLAADLGITGPLFYRTTSPQKGGRHDC